VTQPFFSTVTQSFFRFYQSFCYRAWPFFILSTIFDYLSRSTLSHFATVTRSFFRFRRSFFILLDILNIFNSYFLWFRLRAIETQSFCCSDSVIFRFRQYFLWFHQAFFKSHQLFLSCRYACYNDSAIFVFRQTFLTFRKPFLWFCETFSIFHSFIHKVCSVIPMILNLHQTFF
jgi:hypothetical protein